MISDNRYVLTPEQVEQESSGFVMPFLRTVNPKQETAAGGER
ncbi:MAG: hypothetical protein ABIB93_06120 [Chloroflexota bacterium]